MVDDFSAGAVQEMSDEQLQLHEERLQRIEESRIADEIARVCPTP